jgi:hypothetical protein
MASASDSVPHIVRTAKDPRQQGLFNVKVSEVDQVNSLVRIIQLELPNNVVGSSHVARVLRICPPICL